jgi:hypothetical protein
MDPSLAAVGRQGNKASESTTDGVEERLQSGRARILRLGKLGRSPSRLRINMLRPYKGTEMLNGDGASWRVGGASVLYWRWDTY